MRYLWSGGQHLPGQFGALVTPGSRGVPASVAAGLPWAGDNQAFSAGFNERRFYDWLATMEPYHAQCLFVVAPDVPGDAEATLELYKYFEPDLAGWPLAFVAQDGQEDRELPARFDALFVGGWDWWKESRYAVQVIKQAQAAGKHIHVGRVNTARRFRLFQMLAGSERFTCDGTRQRFDGVAKTWRDFTGYEAQRPLLAL